MTTNDANSTPPLVSCIMPTANRRRFVPRAIDYFLRQDYPNRELVILDDGTDSIEDLVPDHPSIRYIRLDRRATVGAKRNLACEHSQGEIIAHWDDDDWQAPHRLSYQVEALVRTGADVCGVSTLLFYDLQSGRAWRYTYPPGGRAWLSGNTLCYRRSLWERNRFSDRNVGEDALFVWSGAAKRIETLPDHTFHVGIIHGGNVSPKVTSGSCWLPHPAESVRDLLGPDWPFYTLQNQDATMTDPQPARAASSEGHIIHLTNNSPQPETQSSPANEVEVTRARIRNVFACLVHENIECVIDLVRNLRYLDPTSAILLYDGSPGSQLLQSGFPFERYGAVIHPKPKPQSWGRLHAFALDCMEFAHANIGFDTLTIVDSDQLATRPGYSDYLATYLAANPGVGLLGNSPGLQPPNTRVGPVVAAYRERELWRPWLRRFPLGEASFAHWTFWPSTVFTADAARDLVALFARDEQLQEIMRRSAIWANEEVIFPTLVALLGYKHAANPCSYDFVKYKQFYNGTQVAAALDREDVHWLHPVARRYDDPARKQVRQRHRHYERAFNLGEPIVVEAEGEPPRHMSRAGEPRKLLLSQPVLDKMSKVEGWLEVDEADLLIEACRAALTGSEGPHNVLEVGSFCGRATVVMASVMQALCPDGKVWSVDPHDGRVGSLDGRIEQHAPTLDKFRRNISAAEVAGVVKTIRTRACELAWDKPISFLLIDGLHDYANVSRDFFHFERWVPPGDYVAFHDYADYYPGVKAFVHELLATARYERIECVRSLVVLRKV